MKSVKILITLVILFSTVSLSKQTDSSQNAVSKTLPIDGVYEQTSAGARTFKKMIGFFYSNDKVRVRFDKGRAYYVSDGKGIFGNDAQFTPGTVFIDRITMVNQYKYKARWHAYGQTQNIIIRVEGSHLVTTITGKFGLTSDSEYIPIE